MVLHLVALLLSLLWLMRHKVDSVWLSAPAVVKAELGGSVTVSCQYDPYYQEYTKYWCKGEIYELCAILEKTPKSRHNNRCSIVDDKNARAFNVTMIQLRQYDQDKYWCVIATLGRNIHTGVKLLILPAVTTPTLTSPTESVVINGGEPGAGHGVWSWWPALRWILFFSLLCGFVSTHVALWRISTVQ